MKLVTLLRATPCLECKMCGSSSPRSRNEEIPEIVDRYSMASLKVLKISGFIGYSDFDFLKYFVKNANTLEQIIIEKSVSPLPEAERAEFIMNSVKQFRLPNSEEAEHEEMMRNLVKFKEELPKCIELVYLG